MIKRRTTLEEALGEIETGVLSGVRSIVVNADWWQELPQTAQSEFRRRCADSSVDLRADDALSRHFVELASETKEAPLSTERRV